MPATATPPKTRGRIKLSSRPDLVRQLHPDLNGPLFDPATVPVGSNMKLWWTCPTGPDHEWEAAVHSRAAGRGCPYCAGHKVSVTNSLESLHPAVAAQLDLAHPDNEGVVAAQIIAGSRAPIWWRCAKGPDHSWRAVVSSRTAGGNGCPFCAGLRTSVTNSLATRRPDLAAELDPLLNDGLASADVATGSHALLWWRCSVGPDHIWRARVDSRMAGTGCPACAGKQVSSTNSLAAVHPVADEFAEDLNGLTAREVVAGSEKKVWWRCKAAGHTWQARPSARTRIGGTGCPACSGYIASGGSNLLTARPDIAAELDLDHPANAGLDPKMLTTASARRVRWRCPVATDHAWAAKVSERTSKGYGCPFCAGKRPSVTNSLAALAPELASELDVTANDGLQSTDVVAKSNRAVWWRCSANPEHTWKTTPAARVIAGNGCPGCRLVHHSAAEVRLACELESVLPVDFSRHRVVGATKTWDVDIVIPALGVLVEYDGDYWHRGKEEVDLVKTRDLESAGWLVIRVRAGLPRLGENDVVAGPRDSAQTCAIAVLRRIHAAHPGALTETAVAAYEALGGPAAAPLAAARIALLRNRRRTSCVLS